jgi:tetratricopeptide (TPR) repeat protein
MRRVLTPILAGCVSLSTVATALPAAAAAPAGAEMDPQEEANRTKAQNLYREGEKAYRLGKFDVAVEKFEAAYDVYSLPNLLYNIGLANKRFFETSRDPAHLRKAEAVLKNFRIELQKNPDLGSAAEIDKLLKEIAKELDQIDEDERKAAEAKLQAEQKAEEERQKAAREALGDDPGKKMRTASLVLLPAGGTLVLTGATLAIIFGVVKAKGFSSDLNNARAAGDAEAERRALDNGEKANLIGWAVGLPLSVIGIAGVVTGAILLPRSTKKTKEWQKAHQMALTPTFNGGLIFSGRF